MNEYFCLKIEIKNEPSLKMPNLQGFPPTPLTKKVRSNRSATLNSLVGVQANPVQSIEVYRFRLTCWERLNIMKS